jgi:hypothetical protein
MSSEYRFYSLVNFYLSSIQQGIQSGHALGDLVVKYEYASKDQESFSKERKVLQEFLTNHKTWVTLNGGAYRDIKEFEQFLEACANKFELPVPFASFSEDDSLANMTTCVGLVVPIEYYGAMPAKVVLTVEANQDIAPDDYVYVEAETIKVWKIGTPDWYLIDTLKNCSLAR